MLWLIINGSRISNSSVGKCVIPGIRVDVNRIRSRYVFRLFVRRIFDSDMGIFLFIAFVVLTVN